MVNRMLAKLRSRLLVMLALLAWAGCRSPRSPFARTDAPPTPEQSAPTVAVQQLIADSTRAPEPPAFAVVPIAAEQPVGTKSQAEPIAASPLRQTDNAIKLNLFQALETGLAQNPDLVALRRNEGVGRGALGVAQTYPFNPFVQVQATPLQQNVNSGSGTIYNYVLLMQTLQLGHQQQSREESALAALQSVRWNILQAELLNVAQTERLYFTALYQRGLRDVVRANAQLNRELLSVLEKQLAAGHSAAADVAIVRLDARTTEQQAQLAEANYQTALLDLRRQLNLPIAQPLDLAEELQDWRWSTPRHEQFLAYLCPGRQVEALADEEFLFAELVARRPDVMASRFDAAVARANVRLADGSRRPDLQVGPYYQRTESGTTYFGFRAQSDIPVVNNGVPLVRQRQAEYTQRSAVSQQLQVRAELEARAALDRYERAHRLAVNSASAVEESLPDELRRLEEQFKAGEVDILRVVTARTSMIQFRRAQLDSLNELAQAAAAFTLATGLPPDALLTQQPVPTPPANPAASLP